MMKKLVVLACELLFLSLAAFAQQKAAADVYRLIPKTFILPAVVVQEDCPLTVEKFFVVQNSRGRIETEYKVKNTGAKAIKSYRIARWYSDNTGFLQYGMMPVNGRLLQPTMSVETSSHKQIAPAPADTGPTPTLKRIVFFMIVEVEFIDGTMFDANPIFKSFTDHLKLFEGSYDAQ